MKPFEPTSPIDITGDKWCCEACGTLSDESPCKQCGANRGGTYGGETLREWVDWACQAPAAPSPAVAPPIECPSCGSPDPKKCVGYCPDKFHDGHEPLEMGFCYPSDQPKPSAEIPKPVATPAERLLELLHAGGWHIGDGVGDCSGHDDEAEKASAQLIGTAYYAACRSKESGDWVDGVAWAVGFACDCCYVDGHPADRIGREGEGHRFVHEYDSNATIDCAAEEILSRVPAEKLEEVLNEIENRAYVRSAARIPTGQREEK